MFATGPRAVGFTIVWPKRCCSASRRRPRPTRPARSTLEHELTTASGTPILVSEGESTRLHRASNLEERWLQVRVTRSHPIHFGLQARLVKILERPAGQQFAPFQRPPTALGPVANTDTKLLIYGLFQKGRVLAQAPMSNGRRHISIAALAPSAPARL